MFQLNVIVFIAPKSLIPLINKNDQLEEMIWFCKVF